MTDPAERWGIWWSGENLENHKWDVVDVLSMCVHLSSI